MILHNTALLYIISLFNSKIRRNAVISFEFTAIIVVILSFELYEQVSYYQVNHNASVCNRTTINTSAITTTFIDSNGIQYKVTDM